jgi:hypothetical protein
MADTLSVKAFSAADLALACRLIALKDTCDPFADDLFPMVLIVGLAMMPPQGS